MAKKIRVWDGTQWQDVAPSLPYTAIHSAQASMPLTGVDGQVWLDTDGTLAGQDFVPLSGGTMTGNLNVSSINSGSVSGKNYLINGGFDIWQRGTSSSSQMGYYTADRWYTGGTGGTITVSQETSDLPSGVPVQYGIKWTTSAANSYATLYQAIESQVLKTLLGKQVTVSGYIKVSGGYAGSMYGVLEYNTVNDALLSSVTNLATGAAGNAVDAASWKRFSFTTTIPSNAAGLRLGLQPDLAQPSGVTVRLAGLKLELGTTATLFSTAGSTITQELAACQRYYEKSYNIADAPGSNTVSGIVFVLPGSEGSSTAGVMDGYISFKVAKRATPSVTIYDQVGNVNKVRRTRIGVANYDNINGSVDASYENGCYIRSSSSANAANTMTCHFVASAEL